MKQKVLTAMSKVLRPLVRIALKNGIMYSEFVGEIRATYLECARAIALENGREPTAARLRLMTGLPSIDLARLASTDANAGADSAGPTGASGNFHTLSATVLSAWHTGPMYTHAYGIPIELPLRDAKGKPSIAALVGLADPNADAEDIVERLVQARCIRMVGPDRYVVESRVFIPMAMSEDSLRRFGETAERFILTLEHNLLVGTEDSEKRMERAVFADHGIPESRLGELLDRVKEQWSQFADPLDDWMNSSRAIGATSDEAIVQTGVGIYHYVLRDSADANKRPT